MKIRLDFVTNSSSSSFICQVCDENVTGMDLSMEEAEMVQCENGHTFCEEHAIDLNVKEVALAVLQDYLKNSYNKSWYTDEERQELQKIVDSAPTMKEYDLVDIANEYDSWRTYVPKSCCPICQFKTVNKNMAIKYLFAKNGVSTEDVIDEIKEKFTNYDEYCNFIKGEVE